MYAIRSYYVLFYVDPDEKEKGRRLLPVMEAAELEFPPENFQIHFVVNLASYNFV